MIEKNIYKCRLYCDASVIAPIEAECVAEAATEYASGYEWAYDELGKFLDLQTVRVEDPHGNVWDVDVQRVSRIEALQVRKT